jgi:hypothetical protein
MAKKTRYASLQLATKTGDNYSYDPAGSIVGDPDRPGSATVFVEIDHPELKTEEGYPLRGKLVACKFLFPTGEEISIDTTESYLNASFWHAVAQHPKAKK